MPLYQYSPLEARDEEIRLIRLAPGTFDNNIQFEMFHASLHEPKDVIQSPRLNLRELQSTLPKEWIVKETFKGRYLFMRLGEGTPNS